MLSERYWTFRWESHLKYLLLYFFSVCYYYYSHYYSTALWRWFLTYIYSNFENKFFGLSNPELFNESFYASNICLHGFFFLFFCFSFLSFIFFSTHIFLLLLLLLLLLSLFLLLSSLLMFMCSVRTQAL